MTGFPRIRTVGTEGLLVEFGDRIDKDIHARVLALDAALAAKPFEGFTEAVPAYAALLAGYDPLTVNLDAATAHLEGLLDGLEAVAVEGARHEIAVCYDPEFAPNLDALAERNGIDREAAIAAHLGGDYRVFMYGFAPGYAYLDGVPGPIQAPRKPDVVRDVPAGSIIVAASQCLITTAVMPTGWWIIGRSPDLILDPHAERPFRFEPGDRIRFTRIDRAEYERRR